MTRTQLKNINYFSTTNKFNRDSIENTQIYQELET